MSADPAIREDGQDKGRERGLCLLLPAHPAINAGMRGFPDSPYSAV